MNLVLCNLALPLKKTQPLGREKSPDKTDVKPSVPGKKKKEETVFSSSAHGDEGHGWGMAAVPNARVIDWNISQFQIRNTVSVFLKWNSGCWFF